MAILETGDAVCGKLLSEFNGKAGLVGFAADGIESKLNDTISTLSSMSFSSDSILDAAISDFKNTTTGKIPTFENESLDLIMNMINSCNFLNSDKILKNPLSLINSLMSSITDAIFDKIKDLAISIPEFSIGLDLSKINLQFLPPIGDGLGKLMGMLDTIIGCISTFCPGCASQLPGMTSTATDLYSKLSMVSDPLDPSYGKMDTNSIYSAAGLDPTKILKIESTMSSITEMNDKAKSAISDGIGTMKGRILDYTQPPDLPDPMESIRC